MSISNYYIILSVLVIFLFFLSISLYISAMNYTLDSIIIFWVITCLIFLIFVGMIFFRGYYKNKYKNL